MIILPPDSQIALIGDYLHTRGEIYTGDSDGSSMMDVCCQCFNNCDYVIPQFVDDSNDQYKNDFQSFWIQLNAINEAVITLFKIENDGTKTSYQINDNNYGVYFPKGVLKPNLAAFYVQWEKIRDLLGYGKYYFTVEIYANPSTVISEGRTSFFQLMPYSCDAANGTARITVRNTGYIEGGNDYTGLNGYGGLGGRRNFWEQQIRFFGRVIRLAPETLEDYLVTNSRGQEMIQKQRIPNYQLQVNNIKNNASRPLINDYFLSNYITVDDYNINNVENFRNLRVIETGVESETNFPGTENEFFVFNLRPYTQNILKRYK